MDLPVARIVRGMAENLATLLPGRPSEICEAAIILGMDLAEFRPTEEFLRLYQTSQLQAMIVQTGWGRLLDESAPSRAKNISKRALMAECAGLGDKVLRCELPAEMLQAFGLKAGGKRQKASGGAVDKAEGGNDKD